MNTTTTPTNLTVANTIAAQIGTLAFRMMGTQHKLGDKDALIFNVRGSKTVNKVKVRLTPEDVYDVTFWKITNHGLNVKTVSTVEGIYCDQLKGVIERGTGLFLSF